MTTTAAAPPLIEPRTQRRGTDHVAPVDARVEQIRARAAAATGSTWHWAGNTDTGEPYLATWIPGAGRCQVLDIGLQERSTTGPAADAMREDAREYDLGDPEDVVRDWATDLHGAPICDPRLRFNVDLMMVNARDVVVYEVAPNATSRQDRAVYRADIIDIRHPDAQLIAHARGDIDYLLEQNAKLTAALEQMRALGGDLAAEILTNLEGTGTDHV